MIKEYKEVYQIGRLEITLTSLPASTDLGKQLRRFLVSQTDLEPFTVQKCDVGIQVATDGRIWVCINGAAFLRFKPDLMGKGMYKLLETKEKMEKINPKKSETV